MQALFQQKLGLGAWCGFVAAGPGPKPASLGRCTARVKWSGPDGHLANHSQASTVYQCFCLLMPAYCPAVRDVLQHAIIA